MEKFTATKNVTIKDYLNFSHEPLKVFIPSKSSTDLDTVVFNEGEEITIDTVWSKNKNKWLWRVKSSDNDNYIVSQTLKKSGINWLEKK